MSKGKEKMDKEEREHKLRFIEMLLLIATVLFSLRPNQYSILFFLSAIGYYELILLTKDANRFLAVTTAFFFSLPFAIVLADMTPNITPLYHSFLIVLNSLSTTAVLSLILNEKNIVISFFNKYIKKSRRKNNP